VTEPERALDQVARQRQAMAARTRLPWWHPILVAACWATLLVSPFPERDYQRLGVPVLPYGIIAGIGLVALTVMWHSRSALNQGPGLPTYPGLKRRTPLFLTLGLASIAIEIGLFLLDRAWDGALWLSLAVAIISGCSIATLMYLINAEIRQNITDGTVGDD
jgi:hypothetical protein